MSVRREKRCDPETGAEREFWYVDVDLEKPDGTRKRVRKVSPVQTRRGAENYERKLREALVAGTRVGEVKAMEWERDVDMVAKTVTVNLQTRHGVTGTPKGRTRRTIPMSETLYEALRGLNRIRRGYVICNDDGTQKSDNQCTKANYRICRRAGLPERGWHLLRHTFATDAARYAVNPFALMQWLGHKALTETLGYIDFAKNHARPIPDYLIKAGATETDPDKKVMKMLGARANGNLTATKPGEDAG